MGDEKARGRGRSKRTKRLRWREPPELRRAIEAARLIKRSPLRQLGVALLNAGMVMLIWLMATKNPEKNPPPFWVAILLSAGLGVFIAYLVPLLNRFVPAEIKVYKKAIARVRVQKFDVWAFKQISECWIEPIEIEGATRHLLVVSTVKGKTVFIGIADSVPLDELKQTLARAGVTVNRIGSEDKGNSRQDEQDLRDSS